MEEIQLNEFEYEEDWNYDKWSDKQFSEIGNIKLTDVSIKLDDERTILSTSSGQTESIKSFKLKDADLTLSNLKESKLRDAKIKFLNLHKFYPVPKDPGLNSAFWILYPNPPTYKPDGVKKFFYLAQLLKLTPISCLKQQLKSDKVNLKYYCADSKIFQPLIEALLTNITVKSLDLQENYLTIDTCFHLNRLLLQSNVLSSLNLTVCKIGIKGAMNLEEGITNSSSLRDLNLSSCELGNEGLRYISRAVSSNSLLKRLNISNNNLDEGSAIYLQKLITGTQSLVFLDLSWNNFHSKVVSQTIFKSLTENFTIIDINLSWNSIGNTSFPYISQFISNSKKMKRLNLSANQFTADESSKIAQALVTNRYLQELDLNKNPFGSQGVSKFISILNSHEFIHCPLLILNFGNMWATKHVLPIIEKLKQTKPNLSIKIGGILENYTIIGPNVKELFLKTANYMAMHCKKKKERRNFGHFVLSLEDSVISKEKFCELLYYSKIQLSDNLVNEIMNQFLVTKRTIDQAALKESYKSFFPNVKLPELIISSDKVNKKITKRKKKSKRKRKKRMVKKNKSKRRNKKKVKKKKKQST